LPAALSEGALMVCQGVYLHAAGLGGIKQGEIRIETERPDGIERITKPVVGEDRTGDVGPVVDQFLRDAVDADDLVEAGGVELGIPVDGETVGGAEGEGGEEVLGVVLDVLVIAFGFATEVADTVGHFLAEGTADIEDPFRGEIGLATGDIGAPAADEFAVEAVEVGGFGDEIDITAGTIALGTVHGGAGALDDVHGLDLVEAGEEGIAAVDGALTVLIDLAEFATDDGDVGETVPGRGIDTGRVLVEVGGAGDGAGFHLGLGHETDRARRLHDGTVIAHDRFDGTCGGEDGLAEGQTFDDDP